jgi:preprotein translocase subunit SecE
MAEQKNAVEPRVEEKKRKTSVGEFFNQVKAETSKIVWPTREETVRTAIFVFIFMLILSIFFLGIDSAFGAIVRAAIGLLQ